MHLNCTVIQAIYVKELNFTNDGSQPKPHYQMVLSGRDDDPKESDVDTDIESASVSTLDYSTEEIQLDVLKIAMTLIMTSLF